MSFANCLSLIVCHSLVALYGTTLVETSIGFLLLGETVRDHLYHRFVKFVNSLVNSNNITTRLAMNGSRSIICNNITFISHHYSMSRCDLAKVTPKSVSDHDTIIYATVCTISWIYDTC